MPHDGCDTLRTPSRSAALRARDRTLRRRREIALLAVSLGLVVAALLLHEPFLILISVFPALASYGQR